MQNIGAATVCVCNIPLLVDKKPRRAANFRWGAMAKIKLRQCGAVPDFDAGLCGTGQSFGAAGSKYKNHRLNWWWGERMELFCYTSSLATAEISFSAPLNHNYGIYADYNKADSVKIQLRNSKRGHWCKLITSILKKI